jgi:hypothetical protein
MPKDTVVELVKRLESELRQASEKGLKAFIYDKVLVHRRAFGCTPSGKTETLEPGNVYNVHHIAYSNNQLCYSVSNSKQANGEQIIVKIPELHASAVPDTEAYRTLIAIKDDQRVIFSLPDNLDAFPAQKDSNGHWHVVTDQPAIPSASILGFTIEHVSHEVIDQDRTNGPIVTTLIIKTREGQFLSVTLNSAGAWFEAQGHRA